MVAIVDYGVGNLFSLKSSLGSIGADVVVTSNPDEIEWLWSVAQTSPVEFLRYATAEQIEKLRTVRWMLDCGDDDGLIQTNLDFFAEMKREKVAVEMRIRDGVHDWKFWREALPLILEFSFPVK